MTAPQDTAPRSVECQVATETDVVEFVHGLGGPVEIVGYNDSGERVGYVAAIDISPNETEVVVVPGTIARLVATPAPEEETENSQ